MIYTTYFERLYKLPKSIVPIAICARAPRWYKGMRYPKLAPKYDFFMKWKETHDNDYYVRCFNEQVLSGLDINTVISELQNRSGGATDIAMVCYEKPGEFCHRNLVAQWFRDNGIPCEEYEYE